MRLEWNENGVQARTHVSDAAGGLQSAESWVVPQLSVDPQRHSADREQVNVATTGQAGTEVFGRDDAPTYARWTQWVRRPSLATPRNS